MLSVCIVVLLALTGCAEKAEETRESYTSYENYSTYVFLGVDSRAEGEDWKTDTSTGTEGAPSSDVIMLLTINNDTQEAKVLSVFRDTMLDVAGDGSDFEKCNTAFRDGGAYGAIDMLERNLDLRIDGYVTANFMTVADAIDLLGGVTVNIEDEDTAKVYSDSNKGNNVVDVMNAYITEMNGIYSLDTPLIEHAGEQTLTGLQAVAYSRVRYTEGFDIRRTERQRNVVALMAKKLKDADSDTQKNVLKEMYKKVDTDLTETELMSIFDILIDYDLDDMDGFPKHTKLQLFGKKGYMYVPCDLITNVAGLHAFLYNNDSYEPGSLVMQYDQLIKDESGLTAYDADE